MAESNIQEDVKVDETGGVHVDEITKYPEDVTKLINQVRNDEKTKLYGKIDSLKKEREDSQAQIEKLKSALKNIEEASGKKEEMNKTEMEQLINQVGGLTKEIENLNSARIADKVEAEKITRQLQLSAYKKDIINSAGGKIIPEMVSGNSEEELDISAIQAKKKYQEIVESVYQKGIEEKEREIEIRKRYGRPIQELTVGSLN